MRPALTLAAFLVAHFLAGSATAGGIFLPGTAGYGSAAPAYTGPTKKQPLAVGGGCGSVAYGSTVTAGDLLFTECIVPTGMTLAVNAGWTPVYAYAPAFSSSAAIAAACRVAQAGDGSTFSVFAVGGTGGSGAQGAYGAAEIANTGTACNSSIIEARSTSSSPSTLNLSLSLSASAPTLFIAFGAMQGVTSNPSVAASLTGLNGGDLIGVANPSPATSAMAVLTGELQGSGAAVACSWTSTGGSPGSHSCDVPQFQ